ncbi:MAG: NAD-dependent epimerase/dehydratase family protein, partial [Ilumatobacteraceae bacterium]
TNHVVSTISRSTNHDYGTTLRNCDVIIHLAGRVHVFNDPEGDSESAYISANTTATINLARVAVSYGVKRFIFLSSVKVNGESTPLNMSFAPESTPHPIDAYGRSKMAAENGLLEIANSSALEVVIIRPPLVYGPGVRANFLELMKLVYRQIPLPLGSVRNKRSFVGSDNLVSLIVACLDHPAAANQVFLVSDNEDLSTPDLIRLIAQAQNHRSRLFPFPQKLLLLGARILRREQAYLRLCGSLQVDISKTMHLLGWAPVATPLEMLAKTVGHEVSGSRD